MVSNFQVEFGKDRNGVTALQRVPVIYGDSSRQASSIIRQNSENSINAVPAMAVYVSQLQYDRDRLQNPSFVGKLNLRERYYDAATGEYSTQQGDTLTVERLMPVPYKLTLKLDIWTSNTEQKLQMLEQLCTLFNPALEIQSTDNYIDWTSITYVLLTDVSWSSRTIPVGTENPIDVATLTFELPIYISAPALVKKLGVVQKIIASIFDANGHINSESIYDESNLLSRQYITPLQYGVILLNNEVRLVRSDQSVQDEFGTQIIKQIANDVSANTHIILDDTFGIETDMVVSGLSFRGNGTITANTTSNVVTGTNTLFNSSLYAGSTLYYNAVELGQVANVISNTQVILTANTSSNVANVGYNLYNPISSGNCIVLSVDGDTVTTSNLITANAGARIVFNGETYKHGVDEPWRNLVNVYGNLTNGSSQIKFELSDADEIVGTVAYNPVDDTVLLWTPDIDTLPSNTLAPINAIIDPYSSRPNRDLQDLVNGTRYLLVNDYISPDGEQPTYNWNGADDTPLEAYANDIIQYNGQHWIVSFDSRNTPEVNYVTNMTTGVQYRWSSTTWSKSYEGFYEAGKWQLIL
tara:strand:+ start:317 stop:2062 length:1746 start_codon:yes stop_codon:yes gene_type:complete